MNASAWKEIVLNTLEAVAAQEQHLNTLDSAVGDGDHGTTVARGMRSAIAELQANDYDTLNKVNVVVGESMMDAMGGASGVLYGVFFRAARKCETYHEVTVEAFYHFIEQGLAELKRRSGAEAGDKTMLDALIPAVEAVRINVEAGQTDVVEVMRVAAEAAKQGSDATKGMSARFGRSKFLGERVLDNVDPGSVSAALLFQGFYENTKRLQEESK
ncbi:dihydroxyacetone kinase subunit DhaL (plasmid) [Alicyclobacillus fastidiosus]|uniref:Dihydroxyacetone kinase subunit DhaL n=1 Tax=Alicyclobacillus fastidiosus TaxID=392011 RepID=A0ABY6ZRN3_9BACL|nr:dihydroxyacetone kinase subunit DhaL [Alicyclobacillus fastidiosus]WAH44786.1 dihydroxyacetone kinase subunit DhaL [Alicyclobacillus fastidiosus]GMA65741.1 dihydroxyacetone kinase subunit L [Alicyclobacillus fastidiosus]GMA65915.1 dihydroxyacetone kinase subunit L [Alicyclobacillus fastidiosus]